MAKNKRAMNGLGRDKVFLGFLLPWPVEPGLRVFVRSYEEDMQV